MPVSSLIQALRPRRGPSRPQRSSSLQPNTDGLVWRLAEVFARMWDLGFTAFGGPPVHFQILHRRFVDGVGFGSGTKWLDEQTYQELFAICQALPGPASTKMVFWVAMIRAGPLVGFFAFLLWSLPGAVGMYALSLGVQKMPDRLPPIVYALLSGMNSSTVGIIALAAVQLAEKAITDPLTRILVIFGACAGVCYNALWYFPALITAGGVTTVLWDLWLRQQIGKLKARYEARRRESSREDVDAEASVTPSLPLQELTAVTPPQATRRKVNGEPAVEPVLSPHEAVDSGRTTAAVNERCATTPSTTMADSQTHNVPLKLGISIILTFFVSFIVIMTVRGTVKSRALAFDLFANMYLAGTIIFGGGPVVIPLLRSYVVDPGWVSPRDFLLGLAMIQAFPGPNFNFSVYLGALALAPTRVPTVFGAMLGFIGIFAPGLVFSVGVQSIWQMMRTKAWVLSLLRGIHATAVGLVFTAVYRLWEIGYLKPESRSGTSLAQEPWWVVVTALTYAETAWFGVPPAFAILLGALLGLARFGAVGH